MRKKPTSKKSAKSADEPDPDSPTYAELVASSIPVGRVPWLAEFDGRHTAGGKAKRSQLNGTVPKRQRDSKPV